MKKITLSTLLKIRSISDNRLDPFSNDFKKNISEILDPIIKDDYNNDVEYDKDGFDLIEIFTTFNGLYQQFREMMSGAMQKTGLDLIGFTKGLASFCNDYCLFILEEQRKAVENSKEEGGLHHLTQMPVGELKNSNGQTIQMNDVMDNAADTCTELLFFYIKDDIQAKIETEPLEAEELKTVFMYLLELGTVFRGYKDELERFLCEDTLLSIESENIIFKCNPPNYHFLKFANRQREHAGAFQAHDLGRNLSKEKIEVPLIDIADDGRITFDHSVNEDIQSRDTSTSIFVNFYFHLHLAETQTPGLKVNGILDFIVAVEQLFVRCLQKNQQIKPSAFQVRQKDLLMYLTAVTKLPEQIVAVLLGQFSQPIGNDIDLWRRPLISVNDLYCFFYPTITFGSFSARFDNLLAHHMSGSLLNKSFKEHISSELDEPNEKANFKAIDKDVYIDLLKSDNVLVYESNDTIVILKAIMLRYCLTPADCFKTLGAVEQYNDEFQKEKEGIILKLKEINPERELHVLSAIVSNHFQFSGMSIDKTLFLDLFLLVNYIVVGQHSKSVMINDPEIARSEEIAAYPYYEDHESFHKNLVKFFLMPAPLEEMINSLGIERYRISPEPAVPSIFTEIVCLKSLTKSVGDSISELKSYFRQLHYFEVDYKKDDMKETKESLENRIQYLLPIAFSYYALNRSDRNSRLELLEIFKEFGILSFANLVFGLHSQVKSLSSKPIKRTQIAKIGEVDGAMAKKHLEVVMASMASGTSSSLSTTELKHELKEEEIDNLINYLLDVASAFKPKAYTEGELTALYTLIILIANLGVNKEKYEHLLYSVCENYIALLNQNGHFQRARDTAEEILAFSLKKETYPLLGWLCLFKCFTGQKNALDGCFYGIMYFSVLNAIPVIKDFHAFEGLYNSFIYYRNFSYHSLSDPLYKSLQSFELSEYDLQKITLSYFYSLIGTQSRIKDLFPQLENFLKAHKGEIIKYGHQGCHPWVVLFYNLVNLENSGAIILSEDIKNCLAEFETKLHAETLSELKATMFNVADQTPIQLRKALKKANETRDLEDYVAEISSLELIANNLIRESVDNDNLENLLLAGLVINDPSLSFVQKKSEGFTTLSFDEPENGDLPFGNYAATILSKLNMNNGDVICWIFEYNDRIAALFIDHKRAHSIIKLDNWDIILMKEWLDQTLHTFVFNEVKASINEQEQDYIQALKELNFSAIEIPFESNQLFVCTSLELAAFPKNLIIFNSPTVAGEHHKDQAIVKEYVEQENRDFVSYYKPVTDIISIERFAKHGQEVSLTLKELNIEAWVPIDDQDMALYIAYTRMRGPLSDYQCEIRCEIIPRPPLNGQVNFIAAHGEKTGEGFKAVHTKEGEDGHAIINGLGTEHVFGKGIIAVVFICNSGYQSKKIYNQALTSFVNQLIDLGYESVVAPAWKYNPEMCGVWTEEFLAGLKSGLKLSYAVNQANYTTSIKGFDNYWGFYSPSGWASMHLYGNPNIRFV
jgi:hypothetical protein